jgi:Tol biopolymer transport system component
VTRLGWCVALGLMVAALACSTAPRRAGDYKIALTPARRGQYGIFAMNADTSGGKLLTADPGAQLRSTSWSPDGKTIAFFATRSTDAEILNQYRMPFHYLLYVIDAVGGSEKRLLDFPISGFEWSPDSRQMLYISSYEDPQHSDLDVVRGKKIPMSAIYILNIKSGEHRRLTSFGKNCSGSWAPDGKQLALSFGTLEISDIYTVTLDSQITRRLTDSRAACAKPSWSPNGKQIAYIFFPSQGTEQDAGVYLMDAAGTGKRRLSSMQASSVIWSPDGKQLLLQSAAGILLTDPTGEKEENPVPQIPRPMEAQFSPDGKEITFRSDHEGEWHLYALELKSRSLRKITGKLSSATYCLSPLKP